MKKLLPLFLLLGILLSIFRIQLPPKVPKPTVDFSYYTKREDSSTLYTRLSPEPLGELTPSEDYGAIYPFVGGQRTYLYSDYGSAGAKQKLYGFVDATGRILVDPVYTMAQLLESEDGTALPYWLIGKPIYSEEAKDSYMLCALASLDGSFVTPFLYSWFEACEEYIIATLPSGNRYHILDHDLNLLLDTKDLSYEEVYTIRYCGEGLFAVCLNCPDMGNFCKHYVDMSGNVLPGHFQTAYAFTDGWSAVHLDLDTWTYIDPTGKEMGQYFTECTSFQKGYALVNTGKTSQIIRPDGTVVLTRNPLPRWSELTVTSHGLYISPLGDDPHFYYSFEGELLYETPRADWLPEDLIYADYSDPSAPYLYDITQDFKIPLAPMEEGHRLELSTCGDPDSPVIVVRDRNYATWEAVDSYYSADYKLLWVSQPYRTTTSDIPRLELEQVGKETVSYPVLPGENGLTLYGTTDPALLQYPLSTFTHGRLYDDGYLTLTDNFSTRMYDPQGNLIFSYPFATAMED